VPVRLGPLLSGRKRWIIALFSVVVLGAVSFTIVQASATSTPAVKTVQPGTFAGSAFDACTAPSTASMATWKAKSPYRAIGIYIGGNNRGCAQPNLTADWVRTEVAAGWHLIPLYVGPQASCTGATQKKNLIDNGKPVSMGAAAAADAAKQAAALGLAAQSVIIYDMEAYSTSDAACRTGVLSFMSAWTSTLHDLGYLSGFYSSMGSGGADQVANYSVAGYVKPDYIDFARWDKVATVSDAAIPSTYWAGHRRMKQYAGGHTETYGGVTINIDNNLVDFAPLPAAKMADFDRNGWSDVMGRVTSSGDVALFRGNGTNVVAGGSKVKSGWKGFNAIVRIGDLNRDGHDDVVGRTSNGYLTIYYGPSFTTNKVLSKDFARYREITAIGDLNGDGYPDLVAAETSTHNLFFFPGGSGTKLGARKAIAYGGWQNVAELAGVGDFNRDGHPDLIARKTSSNQLYLYLGGKGTIGPAKLMSAPGFAGYRDLIGVGDFDRDGFVDLAAVQSSTGNLMLFRGTGSALLAGTRLATGFGGRSPLL
jgi:hypothetical protein